MLLEGGYNTGALADSVVATLEALSKDTKDQKTESEIETQPVTEDQSPEEVQSRLLLVQKHFAKYWTSLKT